MPNIVKTVLLVKADFPYLYINGSGFVWSSQDRTIHHPTLKSLNDIFFLLHEIAHAELDHRQFSTDIELLRMEASAWNYGCEIAKKYRLTIPTKLIDESLDTYRLWLYTRSLCPTCNQTGMQTTQNTYHCINCRCSWRANEARMCQLQRTKLLA